MRHVVDTMGLGSVSALGARVERERVEVTERDKRCAADVSDPRFADVERVDVSERYNADVQQ